MTLLTKLHSYISNSRSMAAGRSILKSRTAKIVLLRLFKAGIFVLIFILLESQFSTLLDPGRYKSDFHPRMRWEEYYKLDKNVDIAFLGSSHAYRSFDPSFFDATLNVTSFNFGHSDQNPVDSYYVLNEVLRSHHPKLVVFELFFPLMEDERTNRIKASDFLSASYVFDYIKPSFNKLAVLLDDFAPKDYMKAVFHTIRDKDNIKNTIIIKANFQRRINEIKDALAGRKPPNVQPTRTSTGELYKGRGYVENDGIASKKQLQETNRLKVYKGILPDWNKKKLLYIEKTIDLCKAKNIPILLITSPLPPATMQFLTKYEEIHQKLQTIADKHGVQYIDYNYMNSGKSLFADKNFKDEDHLNSSGVKIFDQDVLQYMKPLLPEK